MIVENPCALIHRWFAPFLTMLAGSAVLISCGSPKSPQTSALAGAADTYSVAAGMQLQRAAPGVLANDNYLAPNAQARLVTPATYGTVALEADGAFVYEPNWRFSGYDYFTYEIVSGEDVSAPITVRISPPNVIVILVDDLGQGDIGVYDSAVSADTPNLNALAKAGMVFNHAHSPTAVCSPSRYSILTGNYPYRGRLATGIWDSYEPATMIIPGQITLGDIFRDSGFQTAFIGKLHNGGAYWSAAADNTYTRNEQEIDFSRRFDRGPTQYGFDYSFVLPGGNSGPPYAYFENDQLVRFNSGSGKYEHFASKEDAAKHLVSISGRWNEQFNGGLMGRSGLAIDNFDSRQIGAILTSKALAFLQQAIARNESAYPPKPFFLFFAPPLIHSPYSPPEFFDLKLPDGDSDVTNPAAVAGTANNPRADMIRQTDLMVGAIIDFLDSQNALENTLIIFSSDNGPVTWPDRYPPGQDQGVQLRGYKGEIDEGGHRVPLLARWGDGSAAQSYIAPGQRSNVLLGLNDLAATFYALLGKQRPVNQANDSKNFLPVMLGEPTAAASPREHLIVQGSPPSADSANLLDRAFYKYDDAGDLWKLTVVSSSTDPLAEISWRKLYNLSTDPGESTNQIENPDHEALLRSMQTAYLQLITQPQTVTGWK